MDFPINQMLSKTLASMAKCSEETIHHNNTCIQTLKNTIIGANRNTLLTLKSALLAFTQSETELNFHNRLVSLYLQLIEQQLKTSI